MEQEAMFDLIADGVAEAGYAVVDHFLTAADTASLLEELLALQSQGLLRKAGIGRGGGLLQDERIRGDEIMWLAQDGPRHARAFTEKLEALIAFFNRHCFAGVRDYETHFAAYPPGAFYKRHLDQFKDKGSRKFTFIFYLNPSWQAADGGELRMYLDPEDPAAVLDVAPLAGRLVCFRSEVFEHEVLPTNVYRYSITGWWLNREKEMGFLA